MKIKEKFFAIEIEQNLLGAILFEQKIIFKVMVELDSGKYFYNGNFEIIYNTMINLALKSIPIDAPILLSKLVEINSSISWHIMIAEIVEKTVGWSNWQQYTKIIKEKYNLRELWKLSESIKRKCESDDFETEQILADAQNDIININRSKNIIETQLIKSIIPEYLKKLEYAFKNKDKNNYSVKTGINYLDKLTNGLQPSDLIILAGAPSMGKTATALNIINSSLKQKKNTLFFSLEMSKEQIINRLISIEKQVNASEFLNFEFTESSWNNIISALEFYNDTNLYINDNSSLSPQDIYSIAKSISFEKKIDLIVVDYLQFIKMTPRYSGQTKNEMVGDTTRILKTIAKELKAPVLCLSQLSRAVANRSDKHPILSDLRDSGNIEQDADVVAFCYRDEYYNKERYLEYLSGFEEYLNTDIMEIIIAKQRKGRLGTAVCQFEKKIQTIKNINYNI